MRNRCTQFVSVTCIIAVMATILPVAGHGKSTTERMADGAVIVANMHFRKDRHSESGAQLLRFALYVDPDNAMGLLLQARIERNQEFEKLAFNDGGKKYVENLKGIIAKTRSAPRQLLLYKIIELVLPADEEALVALTKAKNEGLDTTVEGLITAIEGGGETAAAPPRSAAPAAAATLDLRKILHETVISRLHLSAYSPTDPINTLNQHLASRGLVIDMDVSRIPVRKYYDSMTGAPRFHISGEYRAPNMPQHWHTQLENARAEDVLNHVCRMYELGYKFVGNKVVITEPDDPGSVKTLGVQRRADDLVQEFQKEMARSTTQYRGQLVAVVGEVSGIGRSMSRDYVHLAGDKMRVVFDRDASETKLQELKDAYASLGERRYYIEFFGSATCKGLSTGRVVLTDCRDFYWRRLYRTTRN